MHQYTWQDVQSERLNDQITRKMIVGENEMMVRWEFRAGGMAGRHSHPHEQIVMMISGRLKLGVAEEETVMGPGDIVVIPSNVPHEAEALEDTVVIDIFSPPREDFLSDAPIAYLEAQGGPVRDGE